MEEGETEDGEWTTIHGSRSFICGDGRRSPRQHGAVSFYFSNFPEEWKKGNIWRAFEKYGRVVDVYVARKRNIKGKKFGFVRFLKVYDVSRFEDRLNQISIGTFKVNVNLARFKRKETNGINLVAGKSDGVKISCRGAANISYADAVKGSRGGDKLHEVQTQNQITISLDFKSSIGSLKLKETDLAGEKARFLKNLSRKLLSNENVGDFSIRCDGQYGDRKVVRFMEASGDDSKIKYSEASSKFVKDYGDNTKNNSEDVSKQWDCNDNTWNRFMEDNKDEVRYDWFAVSGGESFFASDRDRSPIGGRDPQPDKTGDYGVAVEDKESNSSSDGNGGGFRQENDGGILNSVVELPANSGEVQLPKGHSSFSELSSDSFEALKDVKISNIVDFPGDDIIVKEGGDVKIVREEECVLRVKNGPNSCGPQSNKLDQRIVKGLDSKSNGLMDYSVCNKQSHSKKQKKRRKKYCSLKHIQKKDMKYNCYRNRLNWCCRFGIDKSMKEMDCNDANDTDSDANTDFSNSQWQLREVRKMCQAIRS